jgi:tetratricopeptide (TPR) repeat protein
MKSVSVFSQQIKTFDAFAAAVTQSNHVLTDTQVKRAAKRFNVPREKVMELREQVLARSHAAAEKVEEGFASLQGRPARNSPPTTPKVTSLSKNEQVLLRLPGNAVAEVAGNLNEVPEWIDIATTKVFWGVNTGNETSGTANAILQDAGGNRVYLAIPLAREGDPPAPPKVGFTRAESAESGIVPMYSISPFMAESLIPFLELATNRVSTNSASMSGAGYGAVVARHMAWHCEETVLLNGTPSEFQMQRHLKRIAEIFDAGDTKTAEARVRTLFAAEAQILRSRAYLLFGRFCNRLGRHEEALAALKSAENGLTGAERYRTLVEIASCFNSTRRWEGAQRYAQGAIDEGIERRKQGTPVALGDAYFNLAKAQKNRGHIEEAITNMTAALLEDSHSFSKRLALAGYLAIAGRTEQAQSEFAVIPVPPRTGWDYLNYCVNAAWFHAVAKHKAKALEWAEQALETAKQLHTAFATTYFAEEPDLDWLRQDPALNELLARYQP